MTKRSELTGRRFDRLLVIGRAENDNRGNTRWRCQCDCGESTTAVGYQLKAGNKRSCGCLQRERSSETHRVHGGGDDPEYDVWRSMRLRCLDKRNPNYGGRGIAVCERWQSYANFIADMGRRPSPKHSLDRVDNDSGYNPDNCRWATQKEQCRNTRFNRLVNYAGQKMPLVEACEQAGLPYGPVLLRLNRGWSHDRALHTPIEGGPSTPFKPLSEYKEEQS